LRLVAHVQLQLPRTWPTHCSARLHAWSLARSTSHSAVRALPAYRPDATKSIRLKGHPSPPWHMRWSCSWMSCTKVVSASARRLACSPVRGGVRITGFGFQRGCARVWLEPHRHRLSRAACSTRDMCVVGVEGVVLVGCLVACLVLIPAKQWRLRLIAGLGTFLGQSCSLRVQ
jgi:hypothetical protein